MMKNLLIVILSSLVFLSCNSIKEYYETGELKATGKTTNGLKYGKWKVYHENGKLRQIGKFNLNKQNGEWRFFHDNGNKEGIGNLENGKMVDKWIWNHPNGKIYTERLYESGKLMEIISCFDGYGNKLFKGSLEKGNGSLNNYDIEGNLLEVHNFENGKFKN